MRKQSPNTTAKINSILLRAAVKADRVVERSAEQKEIRVAKMRAELIELGYSIVTTVWLNDVLGRQTAGEVGA
jgi:hypothetical protein